MSAAPLVMRIIALSLNTAKRSGTVIRDVMQCGDLGIVEKAKDDLQTEADRTVQRCIVASLNKQFPRVKVIGEEGNLDLDISADLLVKELDEEFLKQSCPKEWSDLKEEDFVIWVDPLDGTSEYTQGLLDHVTVLIGIAAKNAAIGGVIHQPYYRDDSGQLGRTLWGLKGLGTGGFQVRKAPSDQFIITTTRSHSNPVVQSALHALQPTEVIRVGGAGYKVLQLLEGKAHAYVFARAGCKKWDTCAPEAILEAAGGTLTDMLGNHYAYDADVEHLNRTGILASFGVSNHADIVSKIPANIIESLCAKN